MLALLSFLGIRFTLRETYELLCFCFNDKIESDIVNMELWVIK